MGSSAPGVEARGGLGRELLLTLASWSVIGASIGAVIASLAIRANGSLQGPGQALPFLGLSVATYAALMALEGIAVELLAYFLGRSRASLNTHALAAIAAFAGFVVGQYSIGALTSRGETNSTNFGCSLAVGLALAIACRLWPRRLDSRLSSAAGPILVLFAAAFTCFTVGYGSKSAVLASEPAPRALEVAHSPQGALPRVMLIGVDGADWRRLDPLIAAGRLPNFARLCDGAYRSPLATTLPSWSPIVWTTIVTGVREEHHGVLDFSEVDLPFLSRGVQRTYAKYKSDALLPHDVGLVALFDKLVHHEVVREMPVSMFQRRQKALWNILSENGVKSGFVRWWATWPAEKIDGWMVSDNDPLMQAFAAEQTVNGQVNATTANMTWPIDFARELPPLIKADGPIASSSDEALEALLADPIFEELSEEGRLAKRAHPELLRVFDVIVRGDRFATRTALQLWNEKHVSMLGVYLRAIDNLSHRFGLDPGVVDRTYGFMDARLGELLDAADSDTTVVLVSDHGWCYEPGDDFGHSLGEPGVIIVKGPGVGPASAELNPSVLDVTPTILALYGLPPSTEMSGKALNELFVTGTPPSAKRERIASYGAYRPDLPRPSDSSDIGRKEAVDLLRQLGYL